MSTEHTLAQANLYEFVTGEVPEKLKQRIENHIRLCNECSRDAQTLSDFLQGMDADIIDWSAKQPDEYWKVFVNSVETKIADEQHRKRSVFEQFSDWIDSRVIFRPRDLAIAGIVCTMVLGALFFGKQAFLKNDVPKPVQKFAVAPVDSDYVRLHDYFRKSRALLVGLANAKEVGSDEADFRTERTISRALMKETRKLKQQPLDARSVRLIGDMEKIFIKLANSGNEDEAPEIQLIRNGIERENLLHKLRRAEATYRQPNILLASYQGQ